MKTYFGFTEGNLVELRRAMSESSFSFSDVIERVRPSHAELIAIKREQIEELQKEIEELEIGQS